jgi:hypothetical protein
MLKDILLFRKEAGALVKRALVVRKKGYTIVWTNANEQDLVELWNKKYFTKLRVMPKRPIEGGITQQYWNKLWDLSKPICKGVRLLV